MGRKRKAYRCAAGAGGRHRKKAHIRKSTWQGYGGGRKQQGRKDIHTRARAGGKRGSRSWLAGRVSVKNKA